MTTYIINVPVLTNYGQWQFEGPISVDQASALLADGFVSAVGHEGSADFLSALLDLPVAMNRIEVAMDVGDRAVILRLRVRLPEGQVLSRDELQLLPFDLGLLTRTA